MINSSLLANRLNAFRKGESLPNVESQQPKYSEENLDKVEVKLSQLGNYILQLINLSYIFVKSCAYGFAAKTVFVTDWNFLALVAVGFAFELIFTSILDIFNK